MCIKYYKVHLLASPTFENEKEVHFPPWRYEKTCCLAISNSNWTEWTTIQGVIGRVISKSREADFKLRARLLPELYNMKSNY